MLSNKQTLLPELILNINEYSQGYFRAFLRHHLCLDEENGEELTLESSKKMLTDFFCLAASTFAGGIQRYSGVVKGYHQFSKFIARFHRTEQIHNLATFKTVLLNYWKEEMPAKDFSDLERMEPYTWQVVLLLSYFHMFGLKVASLYLKMLAIDLKFFGVVNEFIPIPLERVNARVVNEVCRGLGQAPLFTEEDMGKLGEVELILRFNNKAEELMGADKQKYFDNLWFVGHFYCDGNRDSPDKCVKREIIEICEWPYLKNLPAPLTPECPLKPICGK